MIISGFCRDVFNKLPMEFAAEADKLLAPEAGEHGRVGGFRGQCAV